MKKAFQLGGHVNTEEITKLIESFKNLTSQKTLQPTRNISAEAAKEIDQRLKDQADKLKWRKRYYICLLVLLFGQNFLVFLLIFLSHWLKIDVKAISIVATATLAETYGLVTIIVKHLVKDIKYKY